MSEEIVEIFESEAVDKDELLGRNTVARGEEVYESQFSDDNVINEIHQFQRQQTEREINKSWNEQFAKQSSKNETIEQIEVENIPKVEESTRKLGSKLSKSAAIYTNDYAFEVNDKRPSEKEPPENSHRMETFKELLESDFDEQLEKLKRLSLKVGKDNNDTTVSDDDDNDDANSSDLTLPSRIQLNFQDLQRLSRLEAKVTELENRIGISEVDSPVSERTPLVTQINKLYRHLKLLESTETDQKVQLDRFKRHLNKLDQDFERTLLDRELRHRASSDLSTSFYSSSFGNPIDTPFVVDETMKINDLYVRYHNLRQFDQYIPHLIRRLKPMQAIHDDVIQTVNTVRSLNEQVSEMRAQFSEWSALLERVDAKLDANIEVLRTGLRSVEEKFEQLQKDQQG